MFMTLRYGRDDGDGVRYLEPTDRPLRSGDNISHSACSSCRSKKLGCSRDLSGCRRCRGRGIKCVYPDRIRRKNPQQSDSSSHSSNSAHESCPPPLPPIFNEEIENGVDMSRPSMNPQSRRPSSTDKQSPKHRLLSNDSGSNGSAAPPASQNSDNDLSMHDKPDSADMQSDEYPSTISDDYFSQLLEPFSGEHEIADQNEVSFDELDRQSSSLASSIDLQPLISGASSQELFAMSHSVSASSSSTSQHNDLSSEDDCECTSSALKILETVAVPLKNTDWNTIERKLSFLKRILTQCLIFSRCRSCAQDSGFAMLVLVLYDKITTTFEEAAQWWKRHLDTPTRLARQEGRGMRHESREVVPWGGSAQQHCMALGQYQIDTMEEHCKILATLIQLQLHRLVSLVSATRRSITNSKWEAHLAFLNLLTHRIKAVQVILNA